MGEGTSAAQPENNNGVHLFNEPLLTRSQGEKPDKPLFRGPLSQLSTSRIAAVISEEPIPALNNLYNQFFFNSLNFHPKFCNNASVESITANENERPLVSDFIPLT